MLIGGWKMLSPVLETIRFLIMHVLSVMRNIWISENIQGIRYIKIEFFDSCLQAGALVANHRARLWEAKSQSLACASALTSEAGVVAAGRRGARSRGRIAVARRPPRTPTRARSGSPGEPLHYGAACRYVVVSTSVLISRGTHLTHDPRLSATPGAGHRRFDSRLSTTPGANRMN